MAEQLARVAGRRPAGRGRGGAWRPGRPRLADPGGLRRRRRGHGRPPPAPEPRPRAGGRACPIATDGVNAAGVGSVRWTGARQLEVPGLPGRRAAGGPRSTPASSASTGCPTSTSAWCGRGGRCGRPTTWPSRWTGNRFDVGAGVFWQVHPQAAAHVLTRAVLEGLGAPTGRAGGRPLRRGRALHRGAGPGRRSGGRRSSRSSGAGRPWPTSAGTPRGSTRSRCVRAGVTPGLVARRLGRPDLVVLDPARAGAGRDVHGGAVRPRPRRPGASPTSRASRRRSPATWRWPSGPGGGWRRCGRSTCSR